MGVDGVKGIEDLFFQPDDVLTFQLSDQQYYAMVCVEVTRYKGEYTYYLVPTSYKGAGQPSADDLRNSLIRGSIIDSGYARKTTLKMQPFVEEVWKYAGQTNFFFGLSYHVVRHKDFIHFKEKFEVAGKLKIKDSFKKESGAQTHKSSFESFEKIFSGSKKPWNNDLNCPVTILCEL